MSKGPEGRKGDGRLRLDEIVLKAAALEGDERSAYLRQLTADHPRVIDEARRLLAAASDVSDSFLVSPASSVWGDIGTPSPATAREPGSLATTTAEERYDVGRRLGAGGMAEVFEAHDRQLDRRVAFKWLHLGDTTAARCLREARAQARVRHDHVLEVYDTGNLEGRPFIALRLVEGPTLDEVGRALPLGQRVELLAQVAEGLHAAHRQGLVHRDVKPSNVLVASDGDGRPKAWISDFGLAAGGDRPIGGTTDAGTEDPLSGTTAYLAPERLEPDAHPDARVDIWSVGVTMYWLLTGALPFEGERLWELLRAIRQARPRPPRDRDPSLPPDLEAIVLRCLAKDPADRYPTAAELAADLRRFTRGEPVLAHDSGWPYRAARFVARHRAWSIFATTALGLLAVALVLAAWLGLKAMRANDRVALRQAQAEDLISFMLLDLRDKLDGLGRLELIDDVGERALRYFAAVPETELTDAELSRHATALNQIGDLRMRQGELAEAERVFEDALVLTEALAAREPNDPQRLFDLGQACFWTGYAARELGELDRAETRLRRYLEISERLVARDGQNTTWQLELSYALSNLGTLARDRGDPRAALRPFERSLSIKQALAQGAPDDLDLLRDVGWAHNHLGVVHDALGHPQQARRHFERDLEIKTALVVAQPDHAPRRDDLGVGRNYLGLWLLRHGRWAAAEPHLREAVSIYERLMATDPENARRERWLAYNLTALGRVRVGLDDLEGGLDHLHRARQILERRRATSPLTEVVTNELATVHNHLAFAYLRQEALADAEHHARAARTISEPLVLAHPSSKVAHQKLSKSLLLLGDAQAAGGSVDDARSSWRRAADTIEAFAEDLDDRESVIRRAQALVRLGDGDAAAPLIGRLQDAEVCMPTFEELCATGTAPPPRS